MTTLHKVLRLIRIFHDTNQKKLAEKLEISKSFLSEIESGKKSITIELLQKYSIIFDIPASSILLFSEKIESNTLSEKTRVFVSKKIIALMEWLVAKGNCHEETKIALSSTSVATIQTEK